MISGLFTRTRRSFTTAAALTVAAAACSAGAPDAAPDPPPNVGHETDPLYVAHTKIWGPSNSVIKTVPVCWLNATSSNAADRALTQQAVEAQWAANTSVNFTGWGSCTDDCQAGVRIRINDEQPHTNGLGTDVNGTDYLFFCSPSESMVLNFTFANWSPVCASPSQHASCVRAIAVHEFGHALGFAHEQNRPDTPSTCTEDSQGDDGDLLVGLWDLQSVMNYCNPNWNNGGILSATDVVGAQDFYGTACGTAAHPNPRARCNGEACTDTTTDAKNCGACGTVCASGLCQNGRCWVGKCRPGQISCCGGDICTSATKCPICP